MAFKSTARGGYGLPNHLLNVTVVGELILSLVAACQSLAFLLPGVETEEKHCGRRAELS